MDGFHTDYCIKTGIGDAKLPYFGRVLTEAGQRGRH